MIAIIANGTEPITSQEQSALARCSGCVCCDREAPKGAPKLLQIVGDLDTYRGTSNLLTDLHADQETNDLTKAVRWATVHFPEEPLAFFGTTGKREDHTLANLSLIADYAQAKFVYTPSGVFTRMKEGEEQVLIVREQAPISFLSFIVQYVTIHGVKWPVEQLCLDTLWRATLNRTLGSQIEITCTAPLLVYQPYEEHE